MTALLNYLLEASFIICLMGVGYFLLLSQEPLFQFRRIYLLTCSLATLVIPLISSDAIRNITRSTGLALDKVVILPPLLIEATHQTGLASNFQLDIVVITVSLYALGVLTAFTFFIQRLLRVNKIIRSCEKKKTHGGLNTLRSTSKYPTFSFFSSLIINENSSLSDLERLQIIEHEKVHISQGHSYDLMLLEGLTIVLWFHPLSWVMKRVQKENHEFIADRQVIDKGLGKGYRALLAKMTLEEGSSLSLVAHYFSKVLIIKRLETIKNNNTTGSYWKAILAGSLFLGLFIFFSSNQDMIQEVTSSGVPNTVKTKLKSLKEKYASIDFYYTEFDLDAEGNIDAEIFDKEFIQYTHSFPGKEKVGLILIPEKQKALFKLASKYGHANGIYNNAEEAPRPSEGLKKFYEYISKNLDYPVEARTKGVEGKVLIEFIVDESGALTQVKAAKGIGHGCDKAALEIVKQAPPWVAGKVDGKAVKVRMVLPITFKLPT